MARYTGPKCRKCRRYGVSLCGTAKCAILRRPQPPGPRSMRRRKISDRGLQLIEKQKVRYAYGLMERQFRRYYERASTRQGVAGHNLMRLLELRLDNVVYRMGFATTRNQARQIVSHGLVAVDGRKLNIGSARVRAGQEVSFTERGRKTEYAKMLAEDIRNREVAGWVEVDRSALKGRVVSEPGPGDWESIFNPNAVIEYYSR
jgi:small subunit ribosomal protein S4